jgi:WD40 repeat protein
MTLLTRRRALTLLCATPLARAADAPWAAPAGPALQVDLAGGELIGLLPSSDGRQIVIDTESALLVVDSMSGVALRAPLKGHRDPAALAQPLADGLRLVVASWGSEGKAGPSGRLALLDTATKRSQTLAALPREPRQLVTSANGQRFAVGDSDEKVQVYDAGGRSLLGPIKPVVGQVVAGTRLERITALALSPDGTRLAVAGEDVQTRLFDIARGKPVLTLDQGPFQGRSWVHGPSQLMVFTPDGARLIAFEQGGNLALYDASSGRPLADPVQVRSPVAAMAMGADGGLWTASSGGQLQRWRAAPR